MGKFLEHPWDKPLMLKYYVEISRQQTISCLHKYSQNLKIEQPPFTFIN